MDDNSKIPKKEISKKETKGIFSSMTATKIKAIIMSVVIAIVLSAFVIYLTESIYPSPKWDDYCGNINGPIKPLYNERGEYVINESQCISEGGSWRNGNCDYYYECQQAFNKIDEKNGGS